MTSPITYGSETTETFSGTVTGQSGDGYPEGTVSVQSGTTVLCSETLPAGSTGVATFSCSPTSDTVLGASTTPYPVTATFTPGQHLVVERQLHLHRLDLDPGAEPHGEQPDNVGTNNLKIQMLGAADDPHQRPQRLPHLR